MVTERLSAMLDGELADAQRALVVGHLDTCEACAAEYQSLANAWRSVRELPRVEPRAHLWPGIETRLGRQTDGQRLSWRARRPFPTLAMAALVVGLLLGFRVGAAVIAIDAARTQVVSEAEADPLHVRYFGDVFPGSLPEAVLSIGVETRTAGPERVR